MKNEWEGQRQEIRMLKRSDVNIEFEQHVQLVP